METQFLIFSHYPMFYFPLALVLIALLVETWLKRSQPWTWPAAIIYLTILAWYFADLIITPEDYNSVSEGLMDLCYGQVALFLLVYRISVPWLTKKFTRGADAVLQQSRPLPPRTLFAWTVAFWGVLFFIAAWMMDGDVIGALFPIDARTGKTMWGRAGGADAGSTGFLVSTGGYLYSLVCGSFGVWFFLVRRPVDKFLAAFFMCLVWPFFLLSGTRSAFLAVSLPFFLAYLLFSRQKLGIKLVCLAAAFMLMNLALRTVITYRGIGFRSLVYDNVLGEDTPEELARHQGLNMIGELRYTNMFIEANGLSYGGRYLQEIVGAVPRAIWPSKPLLGIDYAIWRGFGGADNDLGVFATISTGMIGGGVLNFGRFFGPMAPALLMAVWTALLARWWVQRASMLRCFLFLAGLGLTFNLGRDITLLVLWPVVFGYAITRIVEYLTPRSARRRARSTTRVWNKPDPVRESLPSPPLAPMNRPS